uniref:DUF5727 domain-containing protein n=1 Tax=Echinococcus canadensis TaxID=519352 RepID=A0A915EW06_9CEST
LMEVLIDGKQIPIDVRDGRCYLNGNQEWGSPCEMDEGKQNFDKTSLFYTQLSSFNHLSIIISKPSRKPQQGELIELKKYVPNICKINVCLKQAISKCFPWEAAFQAVTV